MAHNEEKRTTILCCLVSAVLTAALFLCACLCSGVFPGAKYCFLWGDSLISFSAMAKGFMRQLINSHCISYSFKLGMGMPTTAFFAFYSMSPINLLYLIIDDLEIATFCVTIVKFSMASITMCFFLRSAFKNNKVAVVLMSVSYALSSFFSVFYVSFELMDALYIFPLIALGIVKLVREGHFEFLCLIYAYSFFVQFYMAYIMGIFSVVLFLGYVFYKYNGTWVLWKKCVTAYGKSVLIAVMISAPVTIPAAVELFKMRTAEAKETDFFALDIWNFIAGFYPGQAQGTSNMIPYMYSGALVFIITIVFFFSKDINSRKKILLLVPLAMLFLCMFIPQLNYFMHAFDNPNGYAFRYSWLVSFVMCLGAAYISEEIGKHEKKMALWVFAGLLYISLYGAVYFLQHNIEDAGKITMRLDRWLILGCISTGMVYAILRMTGRIRRIFITMLLLTDVFLNIVWNQEAMQEGMIEEKYYVQERSIIQDGLAFVEKSEGNDPWEYFRIYYLNSFSDNESMAHGYNGLGWFSSIENGELRRLLSKYGYATSNLVVYDYGSTPLMRMLFAQKYNLESGNIKTEFGQFCNMSRSEYVLPLGYMVDSGFLDYKTQYADPFSRQNDMISAMCGHDIRIYDHHQGTVDVLLENAAYNELEDGVKISRIENENGFVSYSFRSEQDGNIYAFLSRWDENHITRNIPMIYTTSDYGGLLKLPVVTLTHIIPVPVEEEDACKVQILLQADAAPEFSYENLYIAYENKEAISEAYAELSKGRMIVERFDEGRIEGTVSVDRDKTLLFTSIPYDEGWRIYDNGVEIKPVPVWDNVFTGAELSEGEHKLVFIYNNKWMKYGMCIGFIGLISFIFAVVKNIRLNKSK